MFDRLQNYLDTMPLSDMLQESFWMFIQLFAELSILFLIISFLVGLLRQKLPDSKIRNILGGQKGRGYLTAALLGSITPFCSCSSIPVLVGLLKARAGFGPTMTFLFTSPLLNPLVIALFIPVLGWQVTALYAVLAFSVSVLAGFTLNTLGFERFIKSELLEEKPRCCGSSCGAQPQATPTIWQTAGRETWDMFKQMFPYMFVAMIIGAGVHGFLPADFFTEVAGPQNPAAIPAAALIGIPLYMRVSTLLPLVSAFLAKGVSLGAIMALAIGSGGASLPEAILLHKLFYWPLLSAFLLVVFAMAVLSGFTFNFLFT